MTDDPFDIENLALTDEQVRARLAVVPRKILKRRQHFVQVPWVWIEKLAGAHGQTYRVALALLYLHWKGKGEPIKLANGMLEIDGVSRRSKWRALNDLERRDLIAVERRPRRAPFIRLNLSRP
jgi:hypothetical protein